MNNSRIIVATCDDIRAYLRGQEHSISAEDLQHIPPLLLDEGELFSIDSTVWHYVDPSSPGTQALDGRTCTYCEYGKYAYRFIKDDVVFVPVTNRPCHYCWARNLTRPLLDAPCRWVVDDIVRPSSKIPTTIDVQQKLWDEIQDGSLVGHTVLY
jgi:hypothetical protein